MDQDTIVVDEPSTPETSQSNLPDFTEWQWNPKPSDFDPPDKLYKELYVEWPAQDGRAVRCRLCGKVSKQDQGICNFKTHLGWCPSPLPHWQEQTRGKLRRSAGQTREQARPQCVLDEFDRAVHAACCRCRDGPCTLVGRVLRGGLLPFACGRVTRIAEVAAQGDVEQSAARVPIAILGGESADLFGRRALSSRR